MSELTNQELASRLNAANEHLIGGKEHHATIKEAANRLREDGEQGQAVGEFLANVDGGGVRWTHGAPAHGTKLYTRPQSVAVAGNAVQALPAKWRAEVADMEGTYDDKSDDGYRQASEQRADELEAALSTQPAPSTPARDPNTRRREWTGTGWKPERVASSDLDRHNDT